MAEPYLTDLRVLVDDWVDADPNVGALDCRHFFSGAAAYREGSIVASLTPVGLAVKVAPELRDELIERGDALPLRYFTSGPIKKDYVLFAEPGAIGADVVARLLLGEPA